MDKKICIAIDAMGGENAPYKNIEGISYFCKNKYKLKKKARIECSFPFYYVAETCKSLGITTLVTGLCDDGHFGLSKKAMIHYKHTQEKFDQFRQEFELLTL